MIKPAYILLFALLTTSLSAQEATPIPILLAQTTLGKDLSYSNRDRIDRQILSALEVGDGANNQFSVFVIRPALDIFEQGKIEGLKTQLTVKLNLQLKLTNAMTGAVLAVQDVKASGAGNNLDEAVNRALQTMRRDNPALSKAIKTFRQKISDHYIVQCSNVNTSATELASQKKYREAFAMLHSVPQGTACFQEVSAKKLEYFDLVQTAECQNKMSRANAAVAANDFKTALQILSQIDANAPCFGEAKTAIAAIEPKVDENLKTNYEWLFSFYKEGKAAETARWNAMTAMGLLYLSENKKCVLVER
ncbi:MAG: hypothetical protein Q7T20_02920 [Saprospiraceae bacterium]|nr:hypothetical protein [Saprospiraceae bacterium]